MILNDYTVDELQIHFEAALRLNSRQRLDAAVAVRVGHGADKNAWRKYVKELGDSWKKIELAAGRSLIKADTFFRGLDFAINAGKANRDRDNPKPRG